MAWAKKATVPQLEEARDKLEPRWAAAAFKNMYLRLVFESSPVCDVVCTTALNSKLIYTIMQLPNLHNYAK